MLQILNQYSEQLLEGFRLTILSSFIALIFSLLIGIVMSICQISGKKPLIFIANLYVEFFRNIPLLIVAMFFYVVVPMFWFPLTGFVAGTLGLILYTGAFIADTIRAGILAVPKGQMEAARATGLTFMKSMRYVILPQAFKIVIPPLGNQFISLIKNSSVLALVAGFDLMYQADLIASETFNIFDTYILVALIYLVLTLPLSYYMRHLEQKWAIN